MRPRFPEGLVAPFHAILVRLTPSRVSGDLCRPVLRLPIPRVLQQQLEVLLRFDVAGLGGFPGLVQAGHRPDEGDQP